MKKLLLIALACLGLATAKAHAYAGKGTSANVLRGDGVYSSTVTDTWSAAGFIAGAGGIVFPDATVMHSTTDFAGGGGGSGMQPNATYYIQVRNTLQDGATFYVSSGTVVDFFANTLTTQSTVTFNGIDQLILTGVTLDMSGSDILNVNSITATNIDWSGSPGAGTLAVGDNGFLSTTTISSPFINAIATTSVSMANHDFTGVLNIYSSGSNSINLRPGSNAVAIYGGLNIDANNSGTIGVRFPNASNSYGVNLVGPSGSYVPSDNIYMRVPGNVGSVGDVLTIDNIAFGGTTFSTKWITPTTPAVHGQVFAATADAISSNTVTETSLISSGVGSQTINANELTAGKSYRIKLSGTIASVLTPTLRIKAYLGATAIVDTTAAVLLTITGTNLWTAQIDFTCRTTGASGSVFAQGPVFYYTSATGLAGLASPNTSATTIDTTVSQAIDVKATWGTASSSNNITATNVTIEAL